MPEIDRISHNKAMLSDAEIIAKKLRHVISITGVAELTLAKACGVSKQAVTGWKRTGRILKSNLAIIAKVTGYPLEWWQDPNAAIDDYSPPIAIVGGDTFPIDLANAAAQRVLSTEVKAMLMAAIAAAPLRPASAIPVDGSVPAKKTAAAKRGRSPKRAA